MFRLHLLVAVLCAVGAIVLLFFMDQLYNGFIIDGVESIFGRRAAVWVMHHETGFIMGFICLTIIISFFALEKYLLGKMDRIFKNIGVLFQKNDRFLELDDEFELLEQDLNQLKRESLKHEEQMRLESKQKLDMITYLAHDIKTPLASVIGYLCLLDEAGDLPEDLRKRYISLTLEKAYRLEKLVNEFFEITRFSMGKIPLNKENVDLCYMMRQLAEEFYPMAESAGRTIELQVPEGLYVCADADKLARVFNNILKNALAYGKADSCIMIEALKENGGVTVRIRNQGREIPKEKLNKIFEQFYRLDQSRSSDTGGSGLGLAIAREIVREHGGTIEAQSEAGETVFTVWLPQKKTEDK